MKTFTLKIETKQSLSFDQVSELSRMIHALEYHYEFLVLTVICPFLTTDSQSDIESTLRVINYQLDNQMSIKEVSFNPSLVKPSNYHTIIGDILLADIFNKVSFEKFEVWLNQVNQSCWFKSLR